jgi:hypothetical protein
LTARPGPARVAPLACWAFVLSASASMRWIRVGGERSERRARGDRDHRDPQPADELQEVDIRLPDDPMSTGPGVPA